ncbi:MAG: hypothetical protein HY518_03555 [Candidatus Aenigmarchaeota archaeon]|nr:hypothetical protein [Candidatus Aenigmarchaeota archaeon]
MPESDGPVVYLFRRPGGHVRYDDLKRLERYLRTKGYPVAGLNIEPDNEDLSVGHLIVDYTGGIRPRMNELRPLVSRDLWMGEAE